MTRRDLLRLTGGAVAAVLVPAASAQQPNSVPRIGVLMGSIPSTEAGRLGAFREGLQRLGYIDGRTVSLELRYATVARGGLMSYGPDLIENARLAAGYVGKILHGAKPADLPVQQPAKFVFAVNLKTAQAIGVTIPRSILDRADQVIE